MTSVFHGAAGILRLIEHTGILRLIAHMIFWICIDAWWVILWGLQIHVTCPVGVCVYIIKSESLGFLLCNST